MLLFIDGPDGVDKDIVARTLHLLYNIPLIDTISGDVVFKTLSTTERILYTLNEYNIYVAIPWDKVTAIKIRNPILSHYVYHPEDISNIKPRLKPIPNSLTLILDNGSDDVIKFLKSAEELQLPYRCIKHGSGASALLSVCRIIKEEILC